MCIPSIVYESKSISIIVHGGRMVVENKVWKNTDLWKD